MKALMIAVGCLSVALFCGCEVPGSNRSETNVQFQDNGDIVIVETDSEGNVVIEDSVNTTRTEAKHRR